MALVFLPQDDELEASQLSQKLEVWLEASERYKALILDASIKSVDAANKRIAPRDMVYSINWNGLSKLMRQIRELPEGSPSGKVLKAGALTKLADIYEVLRGAKMPKLEAVRIALANEAKQLTGGSQAV